MSKLILNLILLITLISNLNAEEKKYDENKCIELGFRKTELQCSKCLELNKFDLLELEDDCKACCIVTNEESSIGKVYNNAKLEICNCKLGMYPQIHAFMKHKAKQFKNLVVKHVPGSEPFIKLINDNGVVEEKLSIQKWDTDTIEEFFRVHLVN